MFEETAHPRRRGIKLKALYDRLQAGITEPAGFHFLRGVIVEQHVGSSFDGVISGVTSFGLFVELAESKVNGLIHVTQLPNDYYHFDPIRKTLKGERRGVEYRLGDPVRVLVLRASVEDRRIDFRLVEDADGRANVSGGAGANTRAGARKASETSGTLKAPRRRESRR